MGHDRLQQARRAFEARAWSDAFDLLTAGADEPAGGAAGSSGLEPADLERLAIAAYLAGHDAESTAAWTRAHLARLDRGDHAAAVRCAFWLGFGLVQRGETAQAGGWFARAGSLVAEHGLDCVERGYLLVPEALMAMGGGDHAGALERFGAAAELARRFGDRDLATIAAIGRGEALVRAGRGSEGVRLFDEAMVAVTAGETSPIVSGLVYCAVIDTCQQAFDLRRAREWTTALDRWCEEQPGLVPYRGQCLVHRAQVLQVAGRWHDAAVEARRARERLSDPPHPAVGMAHYELGELHRLRGEEAEAEAAFRAAHACGHPPYPGLALLRLAQGRADAAAAAIERALADAGDVVSRARLLPAHVEILLAVGRVEDAMTATAELDTLATGNATASVTLLHGAAAHARGAVLLARGDPHAALGALHAATEVWRQLDAAYDAARTRVLVAVACRALGDDDTAELECTSARATFERLGAAPALAHLEELRRPPASTAVSPAPVTPRELEVLRLVAAGRTNREIAEAMVISERTVERHLGNIFTKLDVPNRAAATAYAYDHDLV